MSLETVQNNSTLNVLNDAGQGALSETLEKLRFSKRHDVATVADVFLRAIGRSLNWTKQ